MNFIGVIPARYGSSRFPGKPLALVHHRPMIQCVYEQVKKVLSEVYVATDDQRIFDCVKGFGGEVVMTRTDHRCGTERCLEAIQKVLGVQDLSTCQDTVVINIQGDEPFIQPSQIEAIIRCFPTEIATLVKPVHKDASWEQLSNPNSPKVVLRPFNSEGIADVITFSRSVIPFLRGVPQDQWTSKHTFYQHVGMYAYRADILQKIVALPPSILEQVESLEQLRWVENGYTIKTTVCDVKTYSVDTPQDLEFINAKVFCN